MKLCKDKEGFPVNIPVKAQLQQGIRAVKAVVKPDEGMGKAREGSNLSTGTLSLLLNA